MPHEIKILDPEDQPPLIDFLEKHLDTSLFLLSNVEAVGLEDHGQPLQGLYVACWTDGKITAVASHVWNGCVLVQGDIGLEEAARVARARSGRPLNGIIGPLSLVERVRHALGAESRSVTKGDPEILYAIDLAKLRVPTLLDSPDVTCRHPSADELTGLLVDWRVESMVETLGATRGPALYERAREGMARVGPMGWVLCHQGRPVAFSTFNATTHGVVQVGGVYTPRELRRRGYARAVVARSLVAARNEGQRRSVLFTPRGNVAARRAYEALGYEAIGEFGLLLFAEE